MRTDAHHFFELLWVMTEKELRARYKYTIFGFFWLVVNPLLQMLVIGFVFSFFMKNPIKNYNYYLFTGLLIWNFFSLSISKATPSIVFERNLIKKAAFQRSIIPLSIILSNFIHLLIALVIFLIPVFFLGTLRFWSILALSLSLILLLAFTIGVSLFSAALNVRYRDVNFFVQALLIIWFYATPIIYSFLIIPKKFIWLWRLNPMTSILQLAQNALIDYPMPGLAMLSVNIFIIILICVIGCFVFQNESKNFDDWV